MIAYVLEDENYRCNQTLDLEEFLAMSEQRTLKQTLDDSRYTRKAIAKQQKTTTGKIGALQRAEQAGKLDDEKQKKVTEMIEYYKYKPRLKKHPSYGWATEEQIKELQDLPLGNPRRKEILNKIKEQNRRKGKVE